MFDTISKIFVNLGSLYEDDKYLFIMKYEDIELTYYLGKFVEECVKIGGRRPL